MSLLDKGRDSVVVYQEVITTDSDGNPFRKVGTVGIPTVAAIQKVGDSGTSARRAEQDNEGFESERLANIRFTREFEKTYGPIGRYAEVEWQGVRWTVFGDPHYFNGSDRTAHVQYTLKRG